MKQKRDFFTRRPTGLDMKLDNNDPSSPNKKSFFVDEKGEDRDVRTCIDMERNKLRNIDKSMAQKIVTKA